MNALGHDLRFAFRSLRRSPGFAAAAVLTLALGIGANTAVFSVVNGVLLAPLPYPDPEEVVYLGWDWGRGGSPTAITPIQFEYWAENTQVFDGVTTYRTTSVDVGDATRYEPLEGLRVSRDFFTVMGYQPALGRAFTAAEDEPGAQRVAILGHDLWRDRFASSPDVLGRTIRLDGAVHTIVGVMPPEYRVVEHGDRRDGILLPLRLEADPRDSGANYRAMARLKEDATPERIEADLARVFAAFNETYPDQVAPGARGMALMDYEEAHVGGLGRTLWILLGATLLVLLIACADVANLLLARATGRQREIATRAALGAGRGRIVRQLLTESALLGMVGGAVGLLVGVWSLAGLLAAVPGSFPRSDAIGLDVRVLVFAFVVSIGTAMVFGLTSALTAARLNLVGALKEGGRGGGGDRARGRTRDMLIGAEAAVSLVLLVGAGLLIASLLELRQTDLGFEPEGVLSASIERAPAEYETVAGISELERRVLARLREVPGVVSAAGVSTLPLAGQYNFPMTVEDRPEAYESAIQWRAITPDYFETMRIPLLRGRAFDEGDVTGAADVAIINQATADHYWPNGNALGERVVIGRYGQETVPGFPVVSRTIVGIVGNTRDLFVQREPQRTIFVPQPQAAERMAMLPSFVVRTRPGLELREAVAGAITVVEPRLAAPDVRSMEEVFRASIEQERFTLLLMSLFAVLALLLTAIGVYGVVSYTVSQRSGEIGIRLALGARRADVLGLVVRQGMLPVLFGLVVGLLAALGFSRVLAGLVYGVGVRDPMTFAIVGVVLGGVGLAATYGPARRASRQDPIVALRAE